MRELLPPARMIALRVVIESMLPVRVLRRRTALEPRPEVAKRMREAPFIEHRSGHRESCARRSGRHARLRVVQQPLLETVRRRIVFDDQLQQFAFDTETYRIRRLIAFAPSSASLRRLERREKGPADICRPELC
jgi:hypothetical protein